MIGCRDMLGSYIVTFDCESMEVFLHLVVRVIVPPSQKTESHSFSAISFFDVVVSFFFSKTTNYI